MISDTIAAIATPPGNGGIGILRVSGPRAVEIVGKYFTSGGSKSLATHPPRMLVHGIWKESASLNIADELMAVRFQAPHSYTGEEVVEVHAHGGMFHVQGLLKDLLQAGARLAGPGEFTQRAFLNGKMDLTQAEAVADLISARSDLSRRAASRQLAGELRKKVEAMRQGLLEICASVEASLDFPEEEEQLLRGQVLLEKVEGIRSQMKDLLNTAPAGRRLRQGMRVVLCGRTNVGKSSLLNALLGTERAMVSQVQGTTRDFLEEAYLVEGFPMVLVDTAGLGHGSGELEVEAVRRTREQMKEADLALVVLDSNQPLQDEDRKLAEEMSGQKKIPWLVLLNKSDLENKLGQEEALKESECLAVSAKNGMGLAVLNKLMLREALKGGGMEKMEQAMLTQARHEDAMRRAMDSLGHVEKTLKEGRLSNEFLCGDLRAGLDALGEITGAVSRQEVLDEIFSKFCIGK